MFQTKPNSAGRQHSTPQSAPFCWKFAHLFTRSRNAWKASHKSELGIYLWYMNAICPKMSPHLELLVTQGTWKFVSVDSRLTDSKLEDRLSSDRFLRHIIRLKIMHFPSPCALPRFSCSSIFHWRSKKASASNGLHFHEVALTRQYIDCIACHSIPAMFMQG